MLCVGQITRVSRLQAFLTKSIFIPRVVACQIKASLPQGRKVWSLACSVAEQTVFNDSHCLPTAHRVRSSLPDLAKLCHYR